jgi:hypothetical protein
MIAILARRPLNWSSIPGGNSDNVLDRCVVTLLEESAADWRARQLLTHPRCNVCTFPLICSAAESSADISEISG